MLRPSNKNVKLGTDDMRVGSWPSHVFNDKLGFLDELSRTAILPTKIPVNVGSRFEISNENYSKWATAFGAGVSRQTLGLSLDYCNTAQSTYDSIAL